jgi:pimeloyl-ACP methyl ester carboxylesterase
VPRVDLLGFSLGGMVAQQILFERPALVRRAILVGTGGPGASGMFPAEVTREATKYPGDADVMLDLFFSPSEAGQAAGRRHVQRIFSRTDREPASSRQTMEAHHTAIRSWGDLDGEAFARLLDVRQPVPIVNGAHDIMIPPYNAYALSQQLPDAQLILYPDAGHGSLFQYPEWFVHDASRFLGRD